MLPVTKFFSGIGFGKLVKFLSPIQPFRALTGEYDAHGGKHDFN
jgi:hypothetical protein